MKIPGKKGVPMRIREYWNKLMHSTQQKMSRGASNISKIISWPKGESWRRTNKKKPPKKSS